MALCSLGRGWKLRISMGKDGVQKMVGYSGHVLLNHVVRNRDAISLPKPPARKSSRFTGILDFCSSQKLFPSQHD